MTSLSDEKREGLNGIHGTLGLGGQESRRSGLLAAPVKGRKTYPREECDPTLRCILDNCHSMTKEKLGIMRLPRWVGC